MRSKASIKGHPIHAALIPFPFALLWGAFFFHTLGVATRGTLWWATGWHLSAAGILMALVAAVPGLIDFFYTVPPNSTGRQRAVKHLLGNTTAVALFAVAWAVGSSPAGTPTPAVPGLELAGVCILTYAGWLGGTLVTRNQIGVDHRYANAGKWREHRITAHVGKEGAMVARGDELGINQMKLIHINGKRIVLGRTEDGYAAFDDSCTHRGGSLADGALMCGTVQCPWHGSQFDVETGKVKQGPAKAQIKTYRIEEKTGQVILYL